MKASNILFPAIIALMGFSCENESSLGDGRCAQGRLVQPWGGETSGLAIIEMLNDANIGEDWVNGGRQYRNAVRAVMGASVTESNLWKEEINSTDSTFYMEYRLKRKQDVLICYVCCPPVTTIEVSRISISPCAMK